MFLYLDDFICVVNKPAGHVVHRTPGAESSPILLQIVRDILKKKVYPVHRLDRATSGCLAFAFSSDIAKKLQAQLQSNSCIKKYTALCKGHPQAEGMFDRELTNENKIKQIAQTKYRMIQQFDKYSLVELQLLTGRKHQVRRHLSFEGYQIIGDVNHGKGWLNRRFRDEHQFHRMFLHCHYLSFIHPVSGEKLHIHSELDEDLKKLLARLKTN